VSNLQEQNTARRIGEMPRPLPATLSRGQTPLAPPAGFSFVWSHACRDFRWCVLLTAAAGAGLLASLAGAVFPGRAARGSVSPRKATCQVPAICLHLVQGRRRALKATGKAPACWSEPGPPASLWAKKVLLSGTHPNKSTGAPRSSNSWARRRRGGLDEKIPKKSGGVPGSQKNLVGAGRMCGEMAPEARPGLSSAEKHPRGSVFLAAPRRRFASPSWPRSGPSSETRRTAWQSPGCRACRAQP
jgi:hypothetical protein